MSSKCASKCFDCGRILAVVANESYTTYAGRKDQYVDLIRHLNVRDSSHPWICF